MSPYSDVAAFIPAATFLRLFSLSDLAPAPSTRTHSKMVEGGGFEPPKLSRQIYSLIPLTAREPLHFCGAKFCQPQAALSTPNPLLDINIFGAPPRRFEHQAPTKFFAPTPPQDLDKILSMRAKPYHPKG